MASSFGPALLLGTALLAAHTAAQSLMDSSILPLSTSFVGKELADNLDFFDDIDPTSYYVTYISKEDAISGGMVEWTDSSFTMRADNKGIATGHGRKSVRIVSQGEWGDGVYILDVQHMPTGCGVWPAALTVVKKGWPEGSEIYIIKGANANASLLSPILNHLKWTTADYFDSNTASLHTPSHGCEIPSNDLANGTVTAAKCDYDINDNQGCGVRFLNTSSLGSTSALKNLTFSRGPAAREHSAAVSTKMAADTTPCIGTWKTRAASTCTSGSATQPMFRTTSRTPPTRPTPRSGATRSPTSRSRCARATSPSTSSFSISHFAVTIIS